MTKIKIESADGQLGINSSSPMSDTDSNISISDLYSLVKTYDKDFKAGKEVNPALLDEKRAYKIIDITKHQPSAKGSGNNALTSSQAADAIINISQLYSFVKTYDKDFKAGKEVNPALLDENGEKVLYDVYPIDQIKMAEGAVTSATNIHQSQYTTTEVKSQGVFEKNSKSSITEDEVTDRALLANAPISSVRGFSGLFSHFAGFFAKIRQKYGTKLQKPLAIREIICYSIDG